jgi:hypothetical protein
MSGLSEPLSLLSSSLLFSSLLMATPNLIVLDLQSGTFFSAAGSVVLDWDALSSEELDVLVNGSDSERGELGEALGSPLSL